MATYTYAQYRQDVNQRLHNKLGILGDARPSINAAIREATLENDLRSTKRMTVLHPNLFDDVYQYVQPSDLKDRKFISLSPQTQHRSRFDRWDLVGQEEFDMYKDSRFNMVSFETNSMVPTMLLSARIGTAGFTVDNLDAVGDWVGFGDGEDLSTDTYNYVQGAGSIMWNIGSGATTTAGIQNSQLNQIDLGEYLGYGTVFAWVQIVSTDDITDFKCRLGTDSANYYEMTATAQSDDTAFQEGWQLLRWELPNKVTVGSPDPSNINYAALFMTKGVGKIDEIGWHFDYLCIKKGHFFNVWYYSKYAWQSATGVYKENSTLDSDYINADVTEYQLLVEKGVEYIAMSIRELDDYKLAAARYKDMRIRYGMNSPSEAKHTVTRYRNGSFNRTFDKWNGRQRHNGLNN